MNILIAGGSGFIGTNLAKHLSKKHTLTLLTRKKKDSVENYQTIITWDELNESIISQFDIVINLAGFGIATKKWSDSIKQKIIDSRVQTTQRLVDLIGNKPIWLINSSAIGFYPFSSEAQSESHMITRDDQNCGFSQEITQKWEDVVNQSSLKNKTIVRFGVVIGKGGLMDKLVTPARFGMGSIIGKGEQLISWVQIDDLVQAIEFIIENRYANQKFNLSSPNPCTQKYFTKALSKKLNRPQWLVLPEFMVRALFGQMGEELLLSSQNIKPELLQKYGFKFEYTTIEEALEHTLKT